MSDLMNKIYTVVAFITFFYMLGCTLLLTFSLILPVGQTTGYKMDYSYVCEYEYGWFPLTHEPKEKYCIKKD